MNRLSRIPWIGLLLYASSFGQTVSLTGKVTNSAGGAALKDVVVTLMNRTGISGITDANGMYHLSFTNTALPGSRPKEMRGSQIIGNSIRFNVTKKAAVSVVVFTESGEWVRTVAQQQVFIPGNYTVDLPANDLAANLYLVRFTLDNVSVLHRFLPVNGRGMASIYTPLASSVSALSKAGAAMVDTLVFSLPAFGVAKVPISTYSSAAPFNAALLAYPKYKNMRQVPGGTFQMGLVDSLSDWGPVHPVTLSSFWIDTTEVTQAEYQAIMHVNPSHFTDATNYPVEYLTWFDAVLFCNARSKRDGFDTLYKYTSVQGSAGNGCSGLSNLSINKTSANPGYRLPTEAEWEYACRAGTKTLFYWGDVMKDDYAWHFSNASSTTHPVATRKPNLFGLYDMTGNVWELANDWEGPYTADAQTNPMGPATGGSKIIRGASYAYNAPQYWYSASRNGYTPDYQDYHWNTGFRCVR